MTEVGSSLKLQKAITLRHAVALYVSSVLGSGVLVLPGLAAKIAGPSSLIAWIVLSLASYPFAYTFGSLSARKPESGGVYSFAKESFGIQVAGISAWLFALWFITGAPAATLIAASYVSYAFPLSKTALYCVAALVILSAFLINYRGIKFSNKVQLAVVAAIVGLLICAVLFSIGSVKYENFSPFFSNGFLPIGTSAALIFWSYLGYENVSNVAEEFHDPQRDFRRSIALSVVLIGVLYISVAVVSIGTLAYEAGGSVAPFAAIFSHLLGSYGAAGTAILALFIIFGTANAYTAGMSRVIFAAARDGNFPKALEHINNKTGIPDRSLIVLSTFSVLMLLVYYFFNVDLTTALLIPSGAAIIIYIIGSAAGVKLLREQKGGKIFPWISLLMSLAILPFVGTVALVAIVIVAGGLLYSWLSPRNTAKVAGKEL